MGQMIEFNWLLKLKPEQGLDEKNLEPGREYKFLKKEERLYPIEIPIDLVNLEWEIVANVVVKEYTVRKDETKGKYMVLRVYGSEEREFLTKNLKKTLKYNMG
ncbi:MAG: DUF2584 family protein [Nanoarchaeota archaeon]|nr:DUF2584 family protein [Nanoarchaeota archaeon]